MTAPLVTPASLEIGRLIDERTEALKMLKELKAAIEEQSSMGESDDFGTNCGGCVVPLPHSLHCRLSNLIWKLERSNRR